MNLLTPYYNRASYMHGKSNFARLLATLKDAPDAVVVEVADGLNWDEPILQLKSYMLDRSLRHFAEPSSSMEELVHLGDARLLRLILTPVRIKGRISLPEDGGMRNLDGDIHMGDEDVVMANLLASTLIGADPECAQIVVDAIAAADPEFFQNLPQNSRRTDLILTRCLRRTSAEKSGGLLACVDILTTAMINANASVINAAPAKRRSYAMMQSVSPEELRTEFENRFMELAAPQGWAFLIEPLLARQGRGVSRSLWEGLLDAGQIEWATANIVTEFSADPENFDPYRSDFGRRRDEEDEPAMAALVSASWRQATQLDESAARDRSWVQPEWQRDARSRQSALLKTAHKHLDAASPYGMPSAWFFDQLLPHLIETNATEVQWGRLQKVLNDLQVPLRSAEAATWASKGQFARVQQRFEANPPPALEMGEWGKAIARWMDLMAAGDFAGYHPEQSAGWTEFLKMGRHVGHDVVTLGAAEIARNPAQQAALQQALLDLDVTPAPAATAPKIRM